MKIYVVGGFVNTDTLLNIAELIQKHAVYLFKHCIDYDYFADEEQANNFQLTKPSIPESFLCLGIGKSLRIVFEVELGFGREGFYLAKLIKASCSESQKLRHEVVLNHPLTPMKFVLDSEECNSIEIPATEEIDKFLLFLAGNGRLEESEKLPRDVNKGIYSYYKQLCFFSQAEEESSVFDILGCKIS